MRKFIVTVNGRIYEVEIEEVTAFPAAVMGTQSRSVLPPVVDTQPLAAAVAPPALVAITREEPAKPVLLQQSGTRINAPMPGKILSVKVGPGQAVKRGDVLMILEAMKMENEIQSPVEGQVTAIAVTEGANVEAGVLLACIG